MTFSKSRLRKGLIELNQTPYAKEQPRAAVAMIFRFDAGYPEVLLMQRIVRDGDPWSGQVSLPGGREHETDRGLCETAIRETFEEVGVDLTRAELLGCRDAFSARAGGKTLGLLVVPFVFAVEGDLAIILGHEAESAFWLRCDRAANGELDSTFTYDHQGQSLELPCWHHDRYIIWGMTHRLLASLFTDVR
jgi:8-oxo-dGTP pyrophosphatase MutT (NUDIX family)